VSRHRLGGWPGAAAGWTSAGLRRWYRRAGHPGGCGTAARHV